MRIAEYVEHLVADVDLLAEVAARAGLDTAVPTCPDWTVRDLLAHTGEVYRWAGRVLRGEQSGFPTSWPTPPDAELVPWLRDGAADTAALLLAAAPDLQCWTFWPVDDPVAFWARRMADETAVHRIDAQLAVGAPTPVAADLATGGIEELLGGLLAMRPKGVRTEVPVRVAVVVDGGPSWLVTLSAERITTVAGAGPAELTVAGSASDLFTWLWNRGGDVRVSGDPQVASLWQRVRVRLA